MTDRSDDNGRQHYSPGASFTDDAPSDRPLSELPSWLQSFASSVDDQDVAERQEPDAEQQAAETVESDDPSMPSWLSSAREDTVTTGTLASPGGSSFFSEDDLPEWLRALSSEQEAAAPTTGFSAPHGGIDDESEPSSRSSISIPAVSNVWVTGLEARVENPAAELFSVIATSGSSRPELAMAAAPRVGQNRNGAGSEKAAAQVEGGRGKRRTSWTRRERILLIAVIVMMIVLLFVLNINFGG